jgi:hypothetical protein
MRKSMKARIVGIALALVASAAVDGNAQERDTTRHTRSIELGVGGGTSIGIWKRNDSDRSLGIIAGGTLSSQGIGDGDTQRTSTFEIEPALKIHTGGTAAFQPYTFASIFGGIDRIDVDSDAGVTLGRVGASLAVGMDWFPVARVSIGGRVGVRGVYLTGDLTDDVNGADLEGFSVGTFTSGILVNLFF